MPARRDLSRDIVIAAAAEMISAEGLATFSLKRLAARLDVAPPAVSWHVGSRDALLLELSDRVLAQVGIPAPGTDEWLRVFACTFRSVIVSQGQLAPVVLDLLPRAPRTLELLAAVLEEIGRAGFADYELLDRYNAYIGYVVGSTGVEVGQRTLSLRGSTGTEAVLAAVAAHTSPYVQQLFGGQLSPPPLDPDYASHAESSFARGVDALLRGYGLSTSARDITGVRRRRST